MTTIDCTKKEGNIQNAPPQHIALELQSNILSFLSIFFCFCLFVCTLLLQCLIPCLLPMPLYEKEKGVRVPTAAAVEAAVFSFICRQGFISKLRFWS